MNYPPEKNIKLPLLTLIAEMGGNVQFSMYGVEIEKRLADHFGLSEAEKNKIDSNCNSKGHRKWRVTIQYVRLKLIEDGLFIKYCDDYWSVSKEGYNYLTQIVRPVLNFTVDHFRDCWDNRVFFLPELKQLPPEDSELFLHRKIELESLAAQLAKQCWLHPEKKCFKCELCGFSFWEKYGNGDHTFVQDYIEAHLLIPNEKLRISRPNIDDFKLVCSNCHALLHGDKHLRTLVIPGQKNAS